MSPVLGDAARWSLLAAVVVLWLVGFDIIYALQDYEFDRTHGLHSLVVAWGPKNALQAAFLAHLVMCGLLLGLRAALPSSASPTSWAGCSSSGCLVLEHWIARRRSLNWINVAFFRLNAVVSAVFLIRYAGGGHLPGRLPAALNGARTFLSAAV